MTSSNRSATAPGSIATLSFLGMAEPVALLVLRAGAGLLFLEHGLQKVFGLLGGMGPTHGSVPLKSQIGASGLLELIGGTLLALGLFTRPVAFLLTGEMVVAFFQAHFPQGGMPLLNGGELALLYAVIFAFFATHGGGSFSAWMRRSGRSRPAGHHCGFDIGRGQSRDTGAC